MIHACIPSYSGGCREPGRSKLQWALITTPTTLQSGWQSETPPQRKEKGRAWWLTSVISALWEANESRSPEVRSWRPAWPTWQNPISIKSTKISVWWHMPVILATQEAEARELFEPRRWRLQWAEIVPLHSSLGNKSETPSQKKKRKIM